MTDTLKPDAQSEIALTPDLESEIRSFSSPGLLERRKNLQSMISYYSSPEREGNITLEDAATKTQDANLKIDFINKLLPTANFRGESLPEGGLEILPGLHLIHTGKVRNTFAHPTNPERLIIVATDRISTHDVVHQNEIPGKGEAITAVSNYWYVTFAEDDATKHIPTQRALTGENIEEPLPIMLVGQGFESRTNTVKKLRALPIEAIVRGFLYGSALKEYDTTTGKLGTGEDVGKGLKKCSKFTQPLFTPSTKGEKDINIDFDGMIRVLTDWLIQEGLSTSENAQEKATEYANQIKDYSLALYNTANKKVQEKGLTLADTKFEFGLDDEGRLTLIDEVCTPDSSRYWTTDTITEGDEPEQFDKQAIRDWVMSEWKANNEEKSKPPKKIPTEIMKIAQGKYNEIKDKFPLSLEQAGQPTQDAVKHI